MPQVHGIAGTDLPHASAGELVCALQGDQLVQLAVGPDRLLDVGELNELFGELVRIQRRQGILMLQLDRQQHQEVVEGAGQVDPAADRGSARVGKTDVVDNHLAASLAVCFDLDAQVQDAVVRGAARGRISGVFDSSRVRAVRARTVEVAVAGLREPSAALGMTAQIETEASGIGFDPGLLQGPVESP